MRCYSAGAWGFRVGGVVGACRGGRWAMTDVVAVPCRRGARASPTVAGRGVVVVGAATGHGYGMPTSTSSSPSPSPELDLAFVRSQFPAFDQPESAGWSFYENAGGSYACVQTINALDGYYRTMKVQPHTPYPVSIAAGEAMDRSRSRWAEALGVGGDEVHFGPSTSMNSYVLAHAFGQILRAGDQVIVTNQDHEANTGAIRRAATAAGAEIIEWQVDPQTGLLDIDRFTQLLSPATALVTVPHCSNIIGMENDVATITALAHEQGARVVVDGVAFAPHGLPDVGALDADVYFFSLYKTYSVHQGLMVARNGIVDELPNEGHFFNVDLASKRLTPAGPDHAQEAAAGGVLDYVELLSRHHGTDHHDLRSAAGSVAQLWQGQERSLTARLLAWLSASPAVRLIGPAVTGLDGLHRCPTVAFVPRSKKPEEVVAALVARGIMCGSGHFYAARLLEGVGVDPQIGVVRLSWVHYTSSEDMDRLLGALDDIFGA